MMTSPGLHIVTFEIERKEDIPQAVFRRLLEEPARSLGLVGEIQPMEEDEDKGLIVQVEGEEGPASQYVNYVKLLESAAGTVYDGEMKEISRRKFSHQGMRYVLAPDSEDLLDNVEESLHDAPVEERSADEAELPAGQTEECSHRDEEQESQLLLPESELFGPGEDPNDVEEEESQSILRRRRK